MRDNARGSESPYLNLLLDKVYQDSGYDFREYKCGTLTRRLQRRLHTTGSKTYQEYMALLDTCPEEYESLTEDLTIKVSSFFRNGHSFQQIAKLVLPELLADKREQKQRSLNFWSTACTRGKEPYSIAIMLCQFLGDELRDFDISIYASDISRHSLHEAQSGRYSAKDKATLPPTILDSYFKHRGGKYFVVNEIRRMVSFRYFNLVSTASPPFANLDCIFCCNILIYLQRRLQEKVLDMLYNCLATPGYLVLGEVETPTDGLISKMECLDTKAKIYKKNRRKNNVPEKNNE